MAEVGVKMFYDGYCFASIKPDTDIMDNKIMILSMLSREDVRNKVQVSSGDIMTAIVLFCKRVPAAEILAHLE